MGAAHSKRRASRETYCRMFGGKLLSAPRGKPWTKPSAIIIALETLGVTESTLCVMPLLNYARRIHDTVTVPKIRKDVGYSSKQGKDDKGNVFLEYAWVQFNKHKRVMSEADVMAHHTEGKVNRWWDTLRPARVSRKTETVLKVKNKKAVKRFGKKNRVKAEKQASRLKAVGDEVRRKAAETRKRHAKQAVEINAESALIQSFKDMLSKDS